MVIFRIQRKKKQFTRILFYTRLTRLAYLIAHLVGLSLAHGLRREEKGGRAGQFYRRGGWHRECLPYNQRIVSPHFFGRTVGRADTLFIEWHVGSERSWG